MPWIRSIIWADPVYVRLLYLYVRPISRTFFRVSVVCPFVCPSRRRHLIFIARALLTMILAYEYCTVPSFSLQSAVCSIRPQLFSVFVMSVVFMSVVVTATVRHPVRELFYSYSTRTTRTRTVLFRNSPQYGTRANTRTVLVRVLVCSIPA